MNTYIDTNAGTFSPMEELDLLARLIEARRRPKKPSEDIPYSKPLPNPEEAYLHSQLAGVTNPYTRRRALEEAARELGWNAPSSSWDEALAAPGEAWQMMKMPGIKSKLLGGLGLLLSPLGIAAAGVDKLTGQDRGLNMDPGILSLTPTPGNAMLYVSPTRGASVLQKASTLGKSYLGWTAASAPASIASEYLQDKGYTGSAILAGIGIPIAAAHLAGRWKPLESMIERDFSGVAPNKLSSILANERGAVSITPGALSQVWQDRLGSKLTNLGQRIGDIQIPLLPKDSRISRWMGGNTLNEWLLSPQERMDQEAARLFRGVQSESERMSEALRKSAMEMKRLGLNLEEREALRSALRGGADISKLPTSLADRLLPVFAPVQEAGAITRQKLIPENKQAILVRKTLDKHLLRMFAEDPQNPLWVTKKQFAGKYDLTTEKGTLQFLDTVLSDPLTPPEVKTIARDLYDLPAKTALEVGQAYRRAYEALLFRELKSNPKWVIPQKTFMKKIADAHPEGTPNKQKLKEIEKQLREYVEIPGHPEFAGALVHRDVAEGIRDLDAHVTNFRRSWNKYFLNPWKFAKIGLNPPARLRDLFSNLMFNDVYGKNPLSPFRVDVYGEALKDLRDATKGKPVAPELEKYFYYSGGKIDSLNSIATDPVFSAMRHDANPIDNILGALYGNRVSKFMSETMKNIDLWMKYAKFKHNLNNLHRFADENEAIYDAMRATGNMLEQSRAVRNLRDTAMPFAGWTIHALKTIANGMVNHPMRTLKWYLAPVIAAQYALESLDMTPEEYEDFKKTLPEYMQYTPFGVPTRVPLPFRDEKGRIQLVDIGWWIPGLQDLSEMHSNLSNPVEFMQNPAFTLGAALYSNKKFSGAPIYFEWDEPSTKVGKSLAYVLQQLTPPLTPGVGTQFAKLWDAFKGEDPEALTESQATSNIFGARISPIDEANQVKKFRSLVQMHANEAKHQMKEELSKTSDPEEQNRIYDKYTKILERLMQKQAGELK